MRKWMADAALLQWEVTEVRVEARPREGERESPFGVGGPTLLGSNAGAPLDPIVHLMLAIYRHPCLAQFS